MNATSFVPDSTVGSSNVPLLVATSFALVTLLPVAAHQLGALDHLRDPPGDIFASDKITESPTAHPFGVADSLPGIANYGVTLLLALLARRQPHARRLLALKLLSDGSVASINMARQIVIFRKICSWCTGTVICTAAMLIAGRGLIRSEFLKLADLGSGSSHDDGAIRH
jgi:uncharacterized membrane protein